jgi:hypothetical protein
MISLQKFGQWYCRKYKRVETGSASSTGSVNPFVSVLDVIKGKPPRKLSPFHQYFKLHYKSRIRAEYIRRFNWEKEEYENTTEQERREKQLSAPVAISVRSRVGREFWLLESEEFHQEMGELAEKQHTLDVEEWEASQQMLNTPQQFHQ